MPEVQQQVPFGEAIDVLKAPSFSPRQWLEGPCSRTHNDIFFGKQTVSGYCWLMGANFTRAAFLLVVVCTGCQSDLERRIDQGRKTTCELADAKVALKVAAEKAAGGETELVEIWSKANDDVLRLRRTMRAHRELSGNVEAFDAALKGHKCP